MSPDGSKIRAIHQLMSKGLKAGVEEWSEYEDDGASWFAVHSALI